MKVLCPACERLVPLTRFRVDGEALLVTCEKCGAETRVAADEERHEAADTGTSSSGDSPVPSAPRPSHPPDAGPRRPTLVSSPGASNVVMLRTNVSAAVESAAAAADGDPFAVPGGLCPKCLSKRGEAAACAQCGLDFETVSARSLGPPAWLEQEWVALLREWGDEGRHDALLGKALERGVLADMGRLYRLRLAQHPDDPLAERGRGEVLRLAALTVGPTAAADDPLARQLKTLKWVATVVVLVLSLAVTALLARALLAASTRGG